MITKRLSFAAAVAAVGLVGAFSAPADAATPVVNAPIFGSADTLERPGTAYMNLDYGSADAAEHWLR